MKKKYFLPILSLFTVCFAPLSVDSQEVKSFSLKDAQQYAVEYNYDVINSRTDVEIAERTVKENTALGLPQINGTINYNNNLKLDNKKPCHYPTSYHSIQYYNTVVLDMK